MYKNQGNSKIRISNGTGVKVCGLVADCIEIQ